MTTIPNPYDYNPDEQPHPPRQQPYEPHYSAPPNNVELTPEEIRTLKECTSDTFKSKCLPLMFLSGMSVHAGVKYGKITPHAVFGSLPKVTAAVALSWALGRLLSIPECVERIKQLPNSTLAERLRAAERNRGPSRTADLFQQTDVMVPMAEQYGRGFSPGSPNQPESRPDLAFQGPSDEEKLDHRRKRSFEELRNENRMHYAHSLYSGSPQPPLQSPQNQDLAMNQYSSPPELPSDPFTPPPPEDTEARAYRRAAPESYKPVKRNAYGDSWED